MIIALSLAALFSPLLFYILLLTDLSLRTKLIVGGACLVALVALPLLYFWFGSALGL